MLHSNFKCVSGNTQDAMTMLLDFKSFFLSIQLNPLHEAQLIQNIAAKENINYQIFNRDIYQRCTCVSHKRATCLESHVKMSVQLFKTCLETVVFLHPTVSHVFK